ncbi:MAG: MliC family protein [Patescibacteria group bacterium]
MKKRTKDIMIILMIFLLLILAGALFSISQSEEPPLENEEKEGEVFVFECPSGDFIEVSYYENSDSANVIYGEEEYTLNRAVSGSGARYANEDDSVVFWEHQAEAMLEIDGETVAKNCRLPTAEENSEETDREGANNESSEVEDAIVEYLLTKEDFSWKTEEESKNFCVIENLNTEEEEEEEKELFPYYAWVRCGEFTLEDEKLEELSGTSLPVKIDYPEESSAYDTEKFTHEIPRDGSYYDDDLKEIFPEEARNEMSKNRERDINNINEKIELEALKWFSSPEYSQNDNLWEKVKEHIRNCNVKEVSQSHDAMVRITLKNDETARAVQPKLDDIFQIMQNPEIKERCEDDVIMSTE